MDQPLLFLIKLAWASRYRLPLLITVGFMALDIRMQLEIHVQMRRINRGPTLPLRGGRYDSRNVRNRTNSEDSSASWMTIDEDENDLDDGNNLNDSLDSTNTNKTEIGETPSVALNSLDVAENVLDVNLEN